HHQGNRYIAYIGHHGGTPEVPKPLNPLTGKPESNGTSIVDVTDPAHPQYLAHIPGTPGNYEEGGTHRIFYSCNHLGDRQTLRQTECSRQLQGRDPNQ